MLTSALLMEPVYKNVNKISIILIRLSMTQFSLSENTRLSNVNYPFSGIQFLFGYSILRNDLVYNVIHFVNDFT